MSEDNRKSYNRPLSAEDRSRVFKTGAVMSAAAVTFQVGLYLLVLFDVLKLHPKQMKEETLKGFSSRVEYALRYQTLLVFWLLFNVIVTIYGRVVTKALNPLDDSTEAKVQIFKNVLTNSFESVVISVFSQLIFVSFAEPITVLKLIPLINIVQFVGRVTFFAGYPLKRAFGFNCTALPNIIMNVYNMYKLGSFLGLY